MENLVKFKRSLSANQFIQLAEKDKDTIYFINDESKLYLGDRLIAEGNTVTSVNGHTGDVDISSMGISAADGTTYVIYNPTDGGTIVTSEDFNVSMDDTNYTNLSIRKLPQLLNSTTDYSDYLVPKSYVDDAIVKGIEVADALTYCGVIEVGVDESINTNQFNPSATKYTPAANKGDVYKVIVTSDNNLNSSINGIKVETGDMLICNYDTTEAANENNLKDIVQKWDIIQRNEDGVVSGPASSVDDNIVAFDGTTGKIISDSGIAVSDLQNLISALTWK